MTEQTVDRQLLSGEPMSLPRGCDPREIAHFNSQADCDAGENARRWLYRYNPLRLSFVEAMAFQAGLRDHPAGLSGLRLLDVGCGTGIFCEALAGAGASVRGIDPAMSTIAVARREAPTGLDLHYAAETVGEDSETYDIVTAMEVIEHVPDPAAFLAECAGRVRPGGLLVVTTINRTWLSFAFAKVVAEYVLRLLPRGAHEWRRFVRPEEVSGALEPLGFRTLACWGATMDLRTRLMRRATGRGVNYLIALQRP